MGIGEGATEKSFSQNPGSSSYTVFFFLLLSFDFLFTYFISNIFIEFSGVPLVNKIMQVSSM